MKTNNTVLKEVSKQGYPLNDIEHGKLWIEVFMFHYSNMLGKDLPNKDKKERVYKIASELADEAVMAISENQMDI